YRQAEVTWCPTPRSALVLDDPAMAGLYDLLVAYVGASARAAWQTIVEERGLGGADLVNFLCFHLDLSPLEKQTLLEALSDRVTTLLEVLSFKVEERKAVPGGGIKGGGSNLVQ